MGCLAPLSSSATCSVALIGKWCRLPIASYNLTSSCCVREGYASALAAASLQDLGIRRATDVIGGYAAWRKLL